MDRLEKLALWDTPPYAAHAAPILWEPNRSTGEKFVAVIAIRYDAPLAGVVSTHIAFQQQQLRAMIGSKRASSAFGILEHVSTFIRQQLLEGTDFREVRAPFDGFFVGSPARIRGYSETQVIDSSIRTLSAFGTRDSFSESLDGTQRNSVPTSQFLRSLRSVFAQDDDERRSRFNRSVQWPGTPEMTIDYAHDKHIVQVTSLPQSTTHFLALQKEAESKMLELDITASLMRRDSALAYPALLVNTSSLVRPATVDAERIARELLDRLRFMSQQKEMSIIEANSAKEAASFLDGMNSDMTPLKYGPWPIAVGT